MGLLYAGPRPLPFLLKALDDPRTSTLVFSRKGFDEIAMSPFRPDLCFAGKPGSFSRFVIRREVSNLMTATWKHQTSFVCGISQHYLHASEIDGIASELLEKPLS